ncbi:MAG: TIGR02206 family membrane protein [Candidatus Methylacidiphilales bacterium]
MPLFGPSHLTVIALTFLIPLALAWMVRCVNQPGLTWSVNGSLVIILVAAKLSALWLAHQRGYLDLQNALPMHLCDWAFFTALITLIWRFKLAYELTYFWGLAGTMQALLTPDLDFDWPDPRFMTFFLSHGGIIAVVIYTTAGLRMRPTWDSVWRAILASQVYLIVTAGVNLLVDANYGYLCRKPENPSLMDYFGPWPWYILTLEVAAIVSYLLYYSPFALTDYLRRQHQPRP